jgi:hypothetical protein
MESSFRLPKKFCYFASIVSDVLESSEVGPGVGPHVGDQHGPEGRWFDLMGHAHHPPKVLADQP